MKVLFVTRGFPSDKNLMSGNYEAVQAKAIATKGHEVHVIAIHWQNLLHVFESRTINRRVKDGIHVYECKGLTASIPHLYFPKFEHWVREKQFKKVFNEYVKEFGIPDIVHAHIISTASPAIFLKKDLHIPFVITEHWTMMNTDNTSKRVMNQVGVYKLADRVICVSDALAVSLRNKKQVNSLVVHNMVNDIFFKRNKARQLVKSNSFCFIGVGALRKNKGFDILVEAFATAHFPENISLNIVGDGEERRLIENKIFQHNLEKQVKLLGVKTPDEINELFCQSDCFVLSSRLETFAIVIIEAMAKGLPVIATKCGGPETFVRREDGVLVEKENVSELAEAMKYMVTHSVEYDSEEIRRHCYENYSQNVIADKIIDIYETIIKENKNK